MSKIAILGAGTAGFGASHQLNKESIESTIFEKNSFYGGNASSFKKDGFLFDNGPHISFTKNEAIQNLWAESVKNKYNTLKVEVNNFWQGHWIKHPAQVNLNGLPTELVVNIIDEFIEASKVDKVEVNSFKEWLYASYGPTFAETFPMKYGIKFHTTHADNMAVDWVGPRLYKPKMKEVIKGALTSETEDVHYISHFRYPEEGGYVRFLKKFRDESNLKLNHEVNQIDPITKTLSFLNGEEFKYDFLVSSIPLPILIPMIQTVPEKVLQAAKQLACSKCVLVNIGIDRSDISNAIWTYFYDEDMIFTRISFPHLQSINNVPEGCGSIQCEIYFSDKYKPLDYNPEQLMEKTVNDLITCGLLKESDNILYQESKTIPFANVIFDHDRKENLEIVHNYLDEIGIRYCGRYGEWGYQWTDESFVSGTEAAKKIIKEIV